MKVMKQGGISRNGSVAVIVTLIILGLVVVGGIAYVHYVYLPQMAAQSNNIAQSPTSTPVGASSTNNAANANGAQAGSSASRNYSLPLCGATLTVKTGQAVNTAETGSWGEAWVGSAMPDSALDINCVSRSGNSQNISDFLAIQSDGSSQVNKDDYLVFDQQTRSSITQLYLAKNRGYRAGSETVGFETADWLYAFSFLNPAQARDQDSFIISIATGASSQKVSSPPAQVVPPAQTVPSAPAPFTFSISPSVASPAGSIDYHFSGSANISYYTLYLTCPATVGATDPGLNDMCNTTTKVSSKLAAGDDYGPYGGQVNNIGSSAATVKVTATAYDANGNPLGQQVGSFQISASPQ